MSEYIERGMAIAAVTGWETDPTDEELEWALNNVPAPGVVEVKHGRWEKVSWWQHQNRYECNECSLCGCRVKPKFTYNYCPNCGAKMDGE